jgi:hypothetical protein
MAQFRPWAMRGKAKKPEKPQKPQRVPPPDPALVWVRLRPKVEPFLERTSMLHAHAFAERLARRYEELRAELASVGEIAKAFRQEGLEDGKASALRTARTLTVWNHNEAAMLGYLDSGVKQLEWLITEDELTCDACIELNGKVIDIEDKFAEGGEEIAGVTIEENVEHPPAHANCLVGETPVLAPGKRAAFVTTYRGPVVEISLSVGRRLTVTAKHLLLTRHGFARAESLVEGDKVLYYPGFDGVVSGNPDNDGKPACIQEIVEALAETRGVASRRVPVAAEDLHGDGAFCEGEVYVIGANRLLRSYGHASVTKQRQQNRFLAADVSGAALSGESALSKLLAGTAVAADRIMGGRSESLPFRWRKAGHAEFVGLTAVAGGYVSFEQAPSNDASIYTEGAGQGQLRLAGQVALANGSFIESQVTHVEPFLFCGPVYDLQTSSSLYIANGVLSSNCRCVLLPVI